MRRGWHMYEFETEKDIRQEIEAKTGHHIVAFVPRTPENKEMQALLDDGTVIKARSHIQMHRDLNKVKGPGLGL
jgi:hypothetical protein